MINRLVGMGIAYTVPAKSKGTFTRQNSSNFFALATRNMRVLRDKKSIRQIVGKNIETDHLAKHKIEKNKYHREKENTSSLCGETLRIICQIYRRNSSQTDSNNHI